jgi:serine-type D-Ala-D-Ala carboxypeptidase (penicillin-binding protein 5/6)
VPKRLAFASLALVVAVTGFLAADVRPEPSGPAPGAAGPLPVSNGAPQAQGEAPATPAIPAVRAPSAILVDLATDRVLFAKDPGRRLPIASLTKIMTGLLVVERERDLSATVVVSLRAARTAPIDIGLVPNERTTVRALLYGLLLWSGNDAAVALAEHVGGSVPGFLHLMNAKAKKLGLADTYFASTNGLNDHGFSTAADLAALTRAALREATFAQVVATARRTIVGPKAQAIHRLHNLNAMLTTYPGSIGVKTGYTSAAGNCVVEAARRDGRTLIAVVLGDSPSTRWRDAYGDARTLLDYGFASNASPA